VATPAAAVVAGAAAASAAAAVAVMPVPTFFFFFHGPRRHDGLRWGFVSYRQFLTEKRDVGALSMSDRHAMSARNWQHMHMLPTCRRHVGDIVG